MWPALVDAPYALALAAGLLAAVNPCGFALLPAYVSVLVGSTPSDASAAPDASAVSVASDPPDVSDRRLAAVGRALALTGAMTVGFVAVFGVFGSLAAPAAGAVARHLPWLTVAIGLALVGLGAWLVAGRDLPVPGLRPTRGPALRRRFWPMVAFGASYAIASLGCTVGPFLAVVASTFRTESPVAGVGLFIAYAVGMALAVGIVSLAVALARVAVVARLRRLGSLSARVGGGLLVLSGLYVGWYGGYELRVFRGADPGDPIISGAAEVQGALSDGLDALGWRGAIVVFAVLLAAAVALPALRARAGRRS
jgi:cytochrome c-type biogenesis protein